ERDAHAGDDVWDRSRQDNAAQERQPFGAEAARGIDQDRIDAAGARLGVEVEREELGDEDNEDDRRVAKPEPQDRERYPGNARDRVERPDHRIDKLSHRPEPADEQPQWDRK